MKIDPPEIVGKIAALTDHRDLDMLETSLLKTVSETFSPEWAAIYHVRENDPPEFAASISGNALSHVPPEESFTTLASATGMISFSILDHNREVIAYLLLRHAAPLTASEQQLMAGLFRIYDNYLSVLRDSQVDRLTGLLNRHTFDHQLERALTLIRASAHGEGNSDQRRLKAGGAFFLGEIDIDHFKHINDHFGHLYGDEVLIILARILQNSFRKSDLIYRFGGEEFIVIVYVENLAEAEMTFDRLRRSVENHSFPQVGKVTVSIGATRINDSSVPIELLGQADRALYYAKQNGRNQVCFYETLLEENKLRAPNSQEVTMFIES